MGDTKIDYDEEFGIILLKEKFVFCLSKIKEEAIVKNG